MKLRTIILAGALASLLSACGGKKTMPQVVEPAAPSLPDWVLNPYVEDGIASSQCMPYSGNMSVDRSAGIANARADLAQQISLKVNAMSKTYQERIDTVGGTQMGTNFSAVSKQVASQNLVGSRPQKVEFVDIDGKKNLCVLVTLGGSTTKKIFDEIINQSGAAVNLKPNQKDILYQEFKAHKAEKQLDAEIEKMNN
ncbi:MAG: hypothetical protein V2I33_04525 [Kangiellaceae bacterium]|jgi:hypothetical protein|nr:hypothetical protein [Kangiellaceae bacterium]